MKVDEVIVKTMQVEHNANVAKISQLISKRMGANEDEALIIGSAALLHDLGKEFIPPAILNKPGKLTPEEMRIVKTHTTEGFKYIIKQIRVLLYAAVIALQHHERVDGKGYAGITSIHPVAKLVAVADVMDALLSKRVYKEAWSVDEVVEFMNEGRGNRFEPECVDALMESLDEVLAIYLFKHECEAGQGVSDGDMRLAAAGE